MTWKTIIKQQYKAGDSVRYTGLSEEQIQYAGSEPIGLKEGEVYQLEAVDVQNWKTYLTLMGFEGRYNSVGFELANDISKIKKDDKADLEEVTRILEELEDYMAQIDGSPATKEAYDNLRFQLLSDIGMTGEYEPDEGTPLEDAMYSEKERQGNYNASW